MKYYVTVQGLPYSIDVHAGGVVVDGVPVDVQLAPVGADGQFSVLVDGRSLSGIARRRPGSWGLLLEGAAIAVEVLDERAWHIHEMSVPAKGPGGPRPIRAPMPGMVVEVEVEPGDRVSAGQGVVIVEAMKMENELKAEADAVVASVLVRSGQAVEKDEILVKFEQPTETGDEDG